MGVVWYVLHVLSVPQYVVSVFVLLYQSNKWSEYGWHRVACTCTDASADACLSATALRAAGAPAASWTCDCDLVGQQGDGEEYEVGGVLRLNGVVLSFVCTKESDGPHSIDAIHLDTAVVFAWQPVGSDFLEITYRQRRNDPHNIQVRCEFLAGAVQRRTAVKWFEHLRAHRGIAGKAAASGLLCTSKRRYLYLHSTKGSVLGPHRRFRRRSRTRRWWSRPRRSRTGR
jgi:hypothetical protein